MPAPSWRRRMDARLRGEEPPQQRRASRRAQAPATQPGAAPAVGSHASASPSRSDATPRPRTSGDVGQRPSAAPKSRRSAPQPVSSAGARTQPPPAPQVTQGWRDVRTWVLAACLVLGFGLGFLYHVTSSEDTVQPGGRAAVPQPGPDPAEQAQPPPAPPPAPVPAQARTTPTQDPSDLVPEAFRDRQTDALVRDVERRVTDAEMHAAAPSRPAPEAPLPKTPYGGLTGRNVPPPTFQSGPSPAAETTGAEDLGDLLKTRGPGPELE